MIDDKHTTTASTMKETGLGETRPEETRLGEIGAELKSTRLARGLTIADTAQQLRILPEYLTALEKGDAAALPAPVYTSGYIRSYAKFLHLDATLLCQKLHETTEAGGRVGTRAEPYQLPPYQFPPDKSLWPKSSSPSIKGRLALCGLMAVMMGYGGWYTWHSGLIEPQTQGSQAPVPQAQLRETPVPQTPVPPIQESQAPVPQIQGSQAPVPQASEPQIQESQTPVPPTAPVAQTPTQIGQAQAQADARPPADGRGSPPRRGSPPSRPLSTPMILKASATSWVEISRPDGTVIEAWLMRPGDEYTIPNDEEITLTAGNAGGLTIEWGANTAPLSLGAWGETISAVPLGPNLLAEQ